MMHNIDKFNKRGMVIKRKKTEEKFKFTRGNYAYSFTHVQTHSNKIIHHANLQRGDAA